MSSGQLINLADILPHLTHVQLVAVGMVGLRVSLQDDSCGIRGLETMCSKFGRSSDVRQIDSIQLKHGCRQLWEWDRSREEI